MNFITRDPAPGLNYNKLGGNWYIQYIQSFTNPANNVISRIVFVINYRYLLHKSEHQSMSEKQVFTNEFHCQ